MRFKFSDPGLDEVWLENGFRISDSPYGEVVEFENQNQMLGELALAVVQKPARLTAGEFSWLRKHIHMSQGEVAGLIGRTEQAVSLIERKKGSFVSDSVDREFRRLALERLDLANPIALSVETMADLTKRRNSAIYTGQRRDGAWAFEADVADFGPGKIELARTQVAWQTLDATWALFATANAPENLQLFLPTHALGLTAAIADESATGFTDILSRRQGNRVTRFKTSSHSFEENVQIHA